MSDKVALIAGVTGIVGLNLAKLLISKNWKVHGIARRSTSFIPAAVHFHSLDLLNPVQCEEVAKRLGDVTHTFYCTWMKMGSEQENCDVNSKMLSNLLDALVQHAKKLERVTLVTGTKHYLGPFDMYAKQKVSTPFEESQPRLPISNFYYVWEDVLMDRAQKHGFTWTVARPHTIIGYAPGNMMNLGTSVAVYASLCKYYITKKLHNANVNNVLKEFTFPGSPSQYSGVTDVTDGSLLAEHLLWEASTPSAGNNAFNVVNGDVFRWENVWELIAQFFQIPVGKYPGHASPLAISMQAPEIEQMWGEMVKEYNLQNFKLSEIAPWWHVDVDLGRTVECINSMNKSKEMGFPHFRNSKSSFLDLLRVLQQEKIIPTNF